MQQTRPTAVLVIAVLHLVGGSLGLFGAVCGGSMQLAGGSRMFASGAQAKQQAELQERMESQLPGYKVLQYGGMGAGLVLSLLMLGGGLGLLGMKPWARTLSMIYAVLSILNHIFTLIYSLAFTLPAMRTALAEERAQNPQLAPMVAMIETVMTGGLFIGFLFIIYPIVVLIIMLRPSIAAAFRGERVRVEHENDYEEEPDDRWEDRGRRDPDHRFRPEDQ